MKKYLGVMMLLIVLVISACGRPSGGDSVSESNSSGSGDGDKKYKLNVSHVIQEEASGHVAAELFKKNVEERTDGQIEIELYPNGQLYGSDREAIEAVQLGNLEMTLVAAAPVASFNSKFMVFDLPFLFKDREAAHKAIDGELGQLLLEDLESNSIKGLAFAENGFRHMTNNKGPIESPDDLKGLKFRTLENPLHTSTFNDFGANASPFAYGELYTALQQGTYDAMENPIALIYFSKFYEVQDYLTLSGHVYAPGLMLMNNDLFNSMPEDFQTIIMEEAQNLKIEHRKLAAEEETEYFKKLKETGIKVNELTEEQKDLFREKAESVYEKYTPEIGEDLINKALEANE
ncbi:DctP family TRAP transporter solute-binding subunit [Salipaludibacillus sp. CF4.18]|uniref:TRAP transporter substrate-binding protein n=1 Tax=Salipaludibacillus sp. CF4.18 TaxID=3373081 RepID=UPI003EE5BCEB